MFNAVEISFLMLKIEKLIYSFDLQSFKFLYGFETPNQVIPTSLQTNLRQICANVPQIQNPRFKFQISNENKDYCLK